MFGWFKQKEVDPACLMQVEPKKAAASSIYKGNTHYFCAKRCKEAFDKEPGQFLEKQSDR